VEEAAQEAARGAEEWSGVSQIAVEIAIYTMLALTSPSQKEAAA
jgi:hypothetical protein